MAICLVFEAPGMTQAQYEQVLNDVGGNPPAEGALYHVAGPSEDGWYVIEVWQSQEAFDRFFRDTLQGALQRAGINHRPRFLQVANTMQA